MVYRNFNFSNRNRDAKARPYADTKTIKNGGTNGRDKTEADKGRKETCRARVQRGEKLGTLERATGRRKGNYATCLILCPVNQFQARGRLLFIKHKFLVLLESYEQLVQ